VAQATPILFDPERSACKAAEMAHRATAAGARLVLFPEAFIPAYPRTAGFGTVVGSRSANGRELYRRIWETAIDVPGPVVRILGDAAKNDGIYLAVGIIEREREQHGSVYCTLLLFGPDGQLLWRHRKLRPTGSERLIWGEGDGSSLVTVPTSVGRVGGLICWENYMPLARATLYAQGIEIYLAPTADARESWQATLRHIACEGRCFVLGCNQYVTRGDYPQWWADLEDIERLPEVVCRGGSAIYSPLGDAISGPVYDREELLIADLDLGDTVRAKLDFDAAGHYSRPDIFQLLVRRNPGPSVQFTRADEDGTSGYGPSPASTEPR